MVSKRLWLRWSPWIVRILEISWILLKVIIKFKFNINQTKNQKRSWIIRTVNQRIIIILIRIINVKNKYEEWLREKLKIFHFFEELILKKSSMMKLIFLPLLMIKEIVWLSCLSKKMRKIIDPDQGLGFKGT